MLWDTSPDGRTREPREPWVPQARAITVFQNGESPCQVPTIEMFLRKPSSSTLPINSAFWRGWPRSSDDERSGELGGASSNFAARENMSGETSTHKSTLIRSVRPGVADQLGGEGSRIGQPELVVLDDLQQMA